MNEKEIEKTKQALVELAKDFFRREDVRFFLFAIVLMVFIAWWTGGDSRFEGRPYPDYLMQ